jgi:hypothetical protein
MRQTAAVATSLLVGAVLALLSPNALASPSDAVEGISKRYGNVVALESFQAGSGKRWQLDAQLAGQRRLSSSTNPPTILASGNQPRCSM